MEKDTQKEYEISFLLTSSEAEKSIDEVLTKNLAEVFNRKPVVEIPLAYPIKKHSTAYFGFYHFRSNPGNVEKIDAALRLTKDVLRFLVVTPPAQSAAPQATSRPTIIRKQSEVALSNEALEEKLEEILKS